MRTTPHVFLITLLFLVIAAGVYWFSTHDIAGAAFIGAMVMSLLFITSYLFVKSNGNSFSLHTKSRPVRRGQEREPETIPFESYWPLIAAFGLTLAIAALWFLPGVNGIVLALSFATLTIASRKLMRESR